MKKSWEFFYRYWWGHNRYAQSKMSKIIPIGGNMSLMINYSKKLCLMKEGSIQTPDLDQNEIIESPLLQIILLNIFLGKL